MQDQVQELVRTLKNMYCGFQVNVSICSNVIYKTLNLQLLGVEVQGILLTSFLQFQHIFLLPTPPLPLVVLHQRRLEISRRQTEQVTDSVLIFRPICLIPFKIIPLFKIYLYMFCLYFIAIALTLINIFDQNYYFEKLYFFAFLDFITWKHNVIF